MEEMEGCDCVNALGNNLVTRVGSSDERTMLLWRFKGAGGVEEDPIDEIELTDEDRQLHDSAEQFAIKSGIIMAKGEDRDKEEHVLLFGSKDKAVFKLLSQKTS